MFYSCKSNTSNKRSHHHDASSEFVGTFNITFLINELSDLCWSLDLFDFTCDVDQWFVDCSLNSTGCSFVLNGVNDTLNNLSLILDWREFSTIVFASMEIFNDLLVSFECRHQISIDGSFPA